MLLPKIAWCASVASCDLKALRSLGYDVVPAFYPHALVDTPNVIVLQLLGWSHEPVGAAVLATLKACVRWQFCRSLWPYGLKTSA